MRLRYGLSSSMRRNKRLTSSTFSTFLCIKGGNLPWVKARKPTGTKLINAEIFVIPTVAAGSFVGRIHGFNGG